MILAISAVDTVVLRWCIVTLWLLTLMNEGLKNAITVYYPVEGDLLIMTLLMTVCVCADDRMLLWLFDDIVVCWLLRCDLLCCYLVVVTSPVKVPFHYYYPVFCINCYWRLTFNYHYCDGHDLTVKWPCIRYDGNLLSVLIRYCWCAVVEGRDRSDDSCYC